MHRKSLVGPLILLPHNSRKYCHTNKGMIAPYSVPTRIHDRDYCRQRQHQCSRNGHRRLFPRLRSNRFLLVRDYATNYRPTWRWHLSNSVNVISCHCNRFLYRFIKQSFINNCEIPHNVLVKFIKHNQNIYLKTWRFDLYQMPPEEAGTEFLQCHTEWRYKTLLEVDDIMELLDSYLPPHISVSMAGRNSAQPWAALLLH